MKKFVNALTITRIIATLLLPFVWSFIPGRGVVLFVFLILITDFFDGLFARIFNVQTLFGFLADTVADKVFGIVVLLLIAIQLPFFYLLIIAELIITIINVCAAIKGAVVKSSFIGRAKMWLLGASTLLGILHLLFPPAVLLAIPIKETLNLVYVVVFISFGAEIIVIIDYAKRLGKEMLKKENKTFHHFKTQEEIKKALFDTEYYIHHKNKPFIEHLCK